MSDGVVENRRVGAEFESFGFRISASDRFVIDREQYGC